MLPLSAPEIGRLPSVRWLANQDGGESVRMSTPGLRLVASGFLDVTWHPTNVSATATVSLLRDAAGRWRLVLWPQGALLPVVTEGDEPTPLADATFRALFGAGVPDPAAD